MGACFVIPQRLALIMRRYAFSELVALQSALEVDFTEPVVVS
jgi:hypothetical protein